jgi:hypothetical protein
MCSCVPPAKHWHTHANINVHGEAGSQTYMAEAFRLCNAGPDFYRATIPSTTTCSYRASPETSKTSERSRAPEVGNACETCYHRVSHMLPGAASRTATTTLTSYSDRESEAHSHSSERNSRRVQTASGGGQTYTGKHAGERGQQTYVLPRQTDRRPVHPACADPTVKGPPHCKHPPARPITHNNCRPATPQPSTCHSGTIPQLAPAYIRRVVSVKFLVAESVAVAMLSACGC